MTEWPRKLEIYQVDAFAERVFEGNPAAVVPLASWPGDKLLQAIAQENNLSETAFIVPAGEGFELRWFTPEAEVDLCGHATLAAAHVLFEHRGADTPVLAFETRSGRLEVRRGERGLTMDFPAEPPRPVAVPEALLAGLGSQPLEVLAATDYLAVFASQDDIEALKPDFSALARLDRRGVIATAPGREHDVVSRCFYPRLGVPEDPVTGSAHCTIGPFWAERLGRTGFTARQLSRRGGTLGLTVRGPRVVLTGTAVDFFRGTITL